MFGPSVIELCSVDVVRNIVRTIIIMYEKKCSLKVSSMNDFRCLCGSRQLFVWVIVGSFSRMNRRGMKLNKEKDRRVDWNTRLQNTANVGRYRNCKQYPRRTEINQFNFFYKLNTTHICIINGTRFWKKIHDFWILWLTLFSVKII